MALRSVVYLTFARSHFKHFAAPCHVQVAHISGCHGKPKIWPKAYLHQDKPFNVFKSLIDRTVSRITDDSKVVVVEGMLGSGKSKFAERLAKELDYHLVPAFDPNVIFLSPDNHYDMRSIEWKLGEGFFYDLESFYKDQNPERMRAGGLQWLFYQARFYKYAQSLLHLLSTGQGIVMDGSVYSDHVYANALYKCGYMSKPALDHYNKMQKYTICELLRPHVTVFMDVPLSTIEQRIKQRPAVEKNSKALQNAKYIQALDDGLRNQLLPSMRQYGEVLSYTEDEIDWEIIVEDLEQLYLEYEKYVEYKFEDWNLPRDADYAHYRKLYSNGDALRGLFTMDYPFDCTEILDLGFDDAQCAHLLKNHPDIKYATGFDPNKYSFRELLLKF